MDEQIFRTTESPAYSTTTLLFPCMVSFHDLDHFSTTLRNTIFTPMSRIGIIILHWHNAELVTLLWNDLETWSLDCMKIVVDNSGDYLDEKLTSLAVLKPESNLGFAGGCNLRYSNMLLNSIVTLFCF